MQDTITTPPVSGPDMASSAVADKEMQDMLRAGVHLGHAKSKTHTSMQEYIFGVRNTISLLDLAKTKDKLTVALDTLRDIASKGGMVFFVGTRPAGRKAILEVIDELNMPYFTERWIGGTLTNFREIQKRINYLEQLETEKRTGGFEKYTKKERMGKDQEIERLKKHFNGLRTLKRMPNAVFVVDMNEDITAVREARQSNIPVIALVDTNSNAELIDYPIPSNDDALPAVRYMVGRVAEAIKEGRRMLIETKPE